jgi:hypothetical protein
LHDIYEGKTMLNWIHLKRNLYNLRMKESSSFQEHLNEFNALVSKIDCYWGQYGLRRGNYYSALFYARLVDGTVMSVSNTIDFNCLLKNLAEKNSVLVM